MTAGEGGPRDKPARGSAEEARADRRGLGGRARAAKAVIARAWASAGEHQIALMAAGVAFYGFLAAFPGMIAFVMLYGLATDPAQVEGHVAAQAEVLPEAVVPIVEAAARNAAEQSAGALSVGFVLAIGVALWSASAGTGGLMSATTVAYGEEETRGFFRARGLALALTVAVLALVPIALALVAAVPLAFRILGVGGEVWAWGIQLARWLVLAAGVFFGLAFVYRIAPDRPSSRLDEVAPGAAAAGAVWLLASAAFSVYMSTVGETSYGQTYGPFAGVAIFMLWLFISAYVVLFGAELNAALERRARSADGGPHL